MGEARQTCRASPLHTPASMTQRKHPLALILLAAALACGSAFGQANPATASPRTDYQEHKSIACYDALPAGDARTACQLDLHLPAGKPGYATVVWFHGGGLTGGKREIPPGLQGQGIGVIGASYRLGPQAKSPAYIEDAAAAVAWVFKNIERLGGDPARIYVSGASAGGYLATMVGLDKRYLQQHGIDADRIAGLIPLSGHAITHFTIRRERGQPEHQAVVDELAPLFHVRKTAPPLLIVTGDRDKEILGRYEENAYFWRMLKVVGHPRVALLELKGFDHGGMVEPALPHLLRFVAGKVPD